jgi:hypothetical protein
MSNKKKYINVEMIKLTIYLNVFLLSVRYNNRVCNQINTTGATSGAGTAYPSGAPEFTPGFSGDRITRSLALYVVGQIVNLIHSCPIKKNI